MMGVFGEYKIILDSKGRLTVPMEFRKQLRDGDADGFVLRKGLDNCLELYLKSQWKALEDSLLSMNKLDPRVGKFRRLFLDGIATVEIDALGKILIPKHLQQHASLAKDCVFWAQGDKVEIWSCEAKEKYINNNIDSLESLSAELFG